MNQDEQPSRRTVSRRRFLEAGAAAAGYVWTQLGHAAPPDTLRLARGAPRSRVVQVQSKHAILGPTVHRILVGELLEAALPALTNQPTLTHAWHSLLSQDDVIGLKFNRSGQDNIATTPVFASVLVDSLVESGWPPEQIVCIEAPAGVGDQMGTTPPRRGFEPRVTEFGSGADQLALALSQITALIDVPYLKTHNITGMTCALKNLSHGFIKHPARYHSNGCSPYIADIVATPAIRTKLRLCLVDALRVVFQGGPDATAEGMSDEGIVLASLDPVATDLAGLSILNDIRRRRELPPVARRAEDIAYLAAAHRRGLGVAVWHGVDRVRINL